MKSGETLILFLLFGFLLSGTSAADEITLKNGDRLTGKVSTGETGLLRLKTDYSSPLIEIKISSIGTVVTDEPVEIRLKGGEVLKGRLGTDAGGRQTVEPNDGRSGAVLDWAGVEAVNPPPVRWTGNVSLGANLQDGNSDRFSVSAGAEATRKTEKDRFGMRYLYNYAEDEDQLSAKNSYGAMKYDYFFERRFYGFLTLELLSDEFKDLNLRTAVGPGVGYQVWEDSVKSLTAELGLVYFNEDRKGAADESSISGRLSGLLTWKVFQSLVFSDRLIIYPDLRGPEEYRLRNEAGLSSAVGEKWALKLSNIVEYDSEPAPEVRDTDMFWILGLQYSF